jgi:precorrin-2 dehydrogenase/sirohydrochlorin ferrochelatase
MFPVFLELAGRVAVVIGGGTVGRRKAAALLDAGARVRLVCLEPRPDDFAHAGLTWLTAAYAAAHLDDAVLVLAAATPDVNCRVVADARQRGVWVNAATEPEAGDFVLPATVRRGDFVLAVGTGGAAPNLARVVRDRLAEQFDEAFGVWTALLAELRPLVLERAPGGERRRAVLEGLCRWEWLDRLRAEGVESVRRAMRADAGLADE